MDDASFLFHMSDIVQQRTSSTSERLTDNKMSAGTPEDLRSAFLKSYCRPSGWESRRRVVSLGH